MLRHLLLLLCLVGAFSSLSAQRTNLSSTKTDANKITATTSDRTKKEVIAFGLGVVEAYFRRDCDYVWSRFASTIMSFESGQTFSLSPELKTEFCNDNPLRTDIRVNFQMYKDNYNQTAISSAEMLAQYPQIYQKLQMQEGDYFFDGSQRKTATSTSVFRASDSARFIIRKSGTSWVIIAI